MTSKEKLMAEIDDLLAKAFAEPTVIEEKVEKSFDEVSDAKAAGTDVSLDANGGKDIIKNKDKKDEMMEKFGDKKKDDGDEDEDEKKKKAMKKAKDEEKKEEDDEDDKKVKKAKKEDEESEEDKKEDKKEMKKSFTVSEEDYEIITKAKAKAKADAEADADPLLKSISGLHDLVKSQTTTITKLSEEVEALKKSPAREPKSLVGYAPLEKGGADKEPSKLMKSQVLDTLFDLQKAGKVSDIHVCEYESTGNIVDPDVKIILQGELKTKFGTVA